MKAQLKALAPVVLGLIVGSQFVWEVTVADEHEGASLSLEEIVVTASKRETRMRDLPEAVYALQGETLNTNGTIEIEDFIRTVPGVTWESSGRSGSEISIRGINQFYGQGVNTGFYLDEAPLGMVGSNPAFTTYDIARIEILRGPQGTLYGEGSLGGTVRYITEKPYTGGIEGNVQLGWGGITDGGDRNEIAGVLNLPLVQDRLAVRLLGFSRDDDGYIDSDVFGIEDINNYKNSGGRITVLWRPIEELEITAGYSRAKQESDDQVARAFPETLSFNANILQPFEDEYDLFTLQLDYDMFAGSLTSATTYFDREQQFQLDFSLFLRIFPLNPFLAGAFFPPPLPIFPPRPASFPIPPVRAIGIDAMMAPDVFSQEIRFVSNSDGPYTWVAGAFYRTYELNRASNFFSDPNLTRTQLDDIELGILQYYGIRGQIGDNGINRSTATTDIQTMALFGELTYQFTDRLRGLVGARLFKEDRDADSFESGLVPVIQGALAGGLPTFDLLLQSSNSDNVTNLKFSLAYDLSDSAMIYAIAAEGFKGGGENTNAGLVPGAPESYGPETLTSYEIGWKVSFWDDRAYMDGSVYFIDWKDIVAGVDYESAGASIQVVDNVGDASSRGFDLSTTFRLTDNWDLSISGGTVDAKLEEDFLLSGGDLVPEGTQLPDTPEYQASVATSYRFIVGNAFVTLNASFTRIGEATRSLDPTDEFDHRAYEKLNFGASVQLTDNWRITAYLNNATNDVQRQLWARPGSIFGPMGAYNSDRPRSFGLTVRYDF